MVILVVPTTVHNVHITFRAQNSNHPPVLWLYSCNSETNLTYPTTRRTCDTPVGIEKYFRTGFRSRRR